MLRLAELLGGLSLSGDLVNGFPEGKVLRTATLAVEIARLSGAGAPLQRQAFYVTLLRFFGCTGFAHEEALHYGAGDDVSVRHTMADADLGAPLATLGKVVRGIAPGRPLRERVAAIGRLLGDGKAVAQHARAQCDASLHLGKTFGLEPDIVEGLGAVCERWDGKGQPAGQAGETIMFGARALHVADVFELSLTRAGAAQARAELLRRAGGHLDPKLARVAAQHAPALTELVGAGASWERFLAAEPEPLLTASEERFDDVARCVGRIADLKSVFTLGHSDGVCARAAVLAERLGCSARERRDLMRAAWLHDIGRVGIPNRIWDKPGPLDRLERERVEWHAAATQRILARSPALAPLACIAAAAHERLDGSGYHRALGAAAVERAARVLAVADVWQALAEPRAHRAALPAAEVCRVLREQARQGLLDAEVVAAALDEPRPAPAPRVRPHGLSDRELDVLRLVARGKTNKEIASLLGISAKTVQHHVAHAYDKAGIYSRAGAALYVMENGLLGNDC